MISLLSLLFVHPLPPTPSTQPLDLSARDNPLPPRRPTVPYQATRPQQIMASDESSRTLLDGYFANEVTRLSDDHYTANQDECDICRAAEVADPPDFNVDTNTSRTAVIKISSCNHIFHAVCLRGWLSTEIISNDNDGTCPKCRVVLIHSTPAPELVPATELSDAWTSVLDRYQQFRESALELGDGVDGLDAIYACMHNIVHSEEHPVSRDDIARLMQRMDMMVRALNISRV